MRIRRHPDGSFWIPRSDKNIERQMDTDHVRVPGSLRWFPKGYNIELETLRNKYKGGTCLILGKGKSLDSLTVEILKEYSCVICVNDSIKMVNKLQFPCDDVLVVQQDQGLKEECRSNDPKATLLIARQSKGWYADYKNRIVFETQALGIHMAGPTGVCAIKIAQLLGCASVAFYAFDGALGGEPEYADTIGYSATRGGDLSRFATHKQKLIDACKDISFQFLRNESSSDDTLQPSSEHPQERDVLGLYDSSRSSPDTEDSPSEKADDPSTEHSDH